MSMVAALSEITTVEQNRAGVVPGVTMDRTYLYVPPEEYAEVKALGAHWNDRSKCWYVRCGESLAEFSQWLADDGTDEEFAITSDQAHVAATSVSCWKCHAKIEVICIYCESGSVSDEPLERFTVSEVWAMDDTLTRQLEPWSFFRYVEQEGHFANHCPHCAEQQKDMYLHSEPDQPFFSIPRAAPGSIRLTPLVGRVQLSGDESFEI
jgi:hypothetical protein